MFREARWKDRSIMDTGSNQAKLMSPAPVLHVRQRWHQHPLLLYEIERCCRQEWGCAGVYIAHHAKRAIRTPNLAPLQRSGSFGFLFNSERLSVDSLNLPTIGFRLEKMDASGFRPSLFTLVPIFPSPCAASQSLTYNHTCKRQHSDSATHLSPKVTG